MQCFTYQFLLSYTMFLSQPWAQQLLLYATADAGFLCDQRTVFLGTINEWFCVNILIILTRLWVYHPN
jgi:hypothetical protein